MSQKTKMTFQALQQTNSKLSANPEISDHNKEVLQDFLRKARAGGTKDVTLADYMSRLNNLSSHIDFQLDNPDQEDLENFVSKFNQDKITKDNNQPYSDYSKSKFWKTIS